MIIDAHAHIFPDKLAPKAIMGISSFYDGMEINYKGTSVIIPRRECIQTLQRHLKEQKKAQEKK